MPAKKRITVIPGDGIGPEVVSAALHVIAATGVHLDVEERRIVCCLLQAFAASRRMEAGIAERFSEFANAIVARPVKPPREGSY